MFLIKDENQARKVFLHEEVFSVMLQWINEDYAQLGLAYVQPVRKILFLCNDRTDISLECWKDWYSCSPE